MAVQLGYQADLVNPEFPGVYAAHTVGALAGVSGKTIGQWARYGLIRPTRFKGRPANLYSYNDAAEAIVVRWLLRRNFSYSEIHNAIDQARLRYPDWPLLNAPLGVAQHAVAGDPRGIIAERVAGDAYIDVGQTGGQVALKPQLFQDIATMLRTGGWLAHDLGLKQIAVDPRRLGGAPALRGTRWAVESVAQVAADEGGEEILANEYGLDREGIREAIQWSSAAAALG